MRTRTVTFTYTHSVTYLTDKMLYSLKEIIRLSGLSPQKMMDDWEVLERGICKWLDGGFLETVTLEVYDPRTDNLVGRWDFEIDYEYVDPDDVFWVDADEIRYNIHKAGLWPSSCAYRIVTTCSTGRPDVRGWSSCTLRSTDAFARQCLGTTVGAGCLAARGSYYVRRSS